MDKKFVKMVVKNAVHEVGKELGMNLSVEVEDYLPMSLDFKILLGDLENLEDYPRSLYVNSQTTQIITNSNSIRKDVYVVNHGTHSPSNNKADLVQLIVCGKVANRLLYENNKTK